MTAAQVRACFAAAWLGRFGADASDKNLLVLMAQSSLETAAWRRMMCFNFGNVKASPSSRPGAPDYCVFRTTEIENGVSVPQDAPFRAFPDASSGAAFFLAFLATHEPDAWPAVLAGDVDAFAAGLKRDGYFTADAAAYARGLERISRELFPPPHPDVYAVLACLDQLGFADVAELQAAHGLPETGVVDGPTEKAYLAAIAALDEPTTEAQGTT